MSIQEEKYIEALRHEIAELGENKFTGSIVFEFHYHGGSIGNMMVGMKKSVKLVSKEE